MRIKSVGHAVFAATLIGLGVLGLVKGDFTQVWEPVPKGLPGRGLLAYFSALVCLGSGVGLFWQRTATVAARVLLACLVIWTLAFKARFIFIAPTQEGVYQSCGENVVLIAGAWVLYAWFAAEWDRQRLGFATGDKGLRIARMLYGLALIPFGVAHFTYLKHTAELVPGWLPWHVAWAYFTGGAFIAAGIAVLTGVYARLAAALSALQIGMFGLLVWVPIMASGSKGAFQWGETIISFALMAGAWVVADSYRGISSNAA